MVSSVEEGKTARGPAHYKIRAPRNEASCNRIALIIAFLSGNASLEADNALKNDCR